MINYAFDSTGRTNAVTGTNFGGVTQYATNMQYRAWGAIKGLSYGNTHTQTTTYNARLQPEHFEIPGVMAKDYQYHADGGTKFSADLLDNKLDRSYSYDHAGRIKEAFSGPLARGQTDTNDRPYKEFYQYDAMSHLVGRVGSRHWSQPLPGAAVTDTFVNNRNPNWEYDADGRLIDGADIQSTFDAAGRATTVVSNAGNNTQTRMYDGDGRQSRMVDVVTEDDGFGNMITTTTTRYSVSSTVVGKVITELDEMGQKTRSFVYNGGQVLAWQQKWGSFEQVSWEYRDVSDASYRMATANGAIDEERAAEMDPLDSNAGATTPYSQSSHQHWPGEDGIYPGFADLTNPGCYMEGMPFPCDVVSRLMQSGAAAQCPNNDCGPQFIPNRDGTGRGGWVELRLGPNGFYHKRLGPSTKPPGDPQNTGRHIVPLGNLQKGLEDLLKTGDCGVFVQRLINKANSLFGGGQPHATSFWDAFSRIQDAGGYQLNDVPNGGTVSGDLFFGEFSNPSLPEIATAGPGTVHITPFGPIGRSARAAEAALAQARYVYKAFHETLHLAKRGWYYDRELALAGHEVDGTTAPDYAKDAYLQWSGNLDEVLKRHCAYPSK